jgi:hypothetical protein
MKTALSAAMRARKRGGIAGLSTEIEKMLTGLIKHL